VEGLDAKDAIDIQVTVGSLDAADELAEALTSAGYLRMPITADVSKPDSRSTVTEFDHTGGEALWHKRIHASADPGRPTNVHLRVDGWPNQQFALLFVDWLAANPDARERYLTVKREAERSTTHDGGIEAYVAAKEPWFLDAYRQAWAWADTSGWRPEQA
jgi:dephospho-CoA kinase